MRKQLESFDECIINNAQKIFPIFSRVALFIVYFWFGLLKVIGYSPAGPLVEELLKKTIPFLTANQFIFYFGCLEMLIGVLFLIPKFSRVVIFILAIHMITTAGPLVMLPQIAWQTWFVPTLEGQYIIKNLLIISTAIGIVTGIQPWKAQKTSKK
jgi:uncharacterized membrane protein YkgB